MSNSTYIPVTLPSITKSLSRFASTKQGLCNGVSKRFWDIGCDVVGDFAATRICPIHIGRLRNLGHTYEPNCICCDTFPVPTILFNCTNCLLRGAEQISPYVCAHHVNFHVVTAQRYYRNQRSYVYSDISLIPLLFSRIHDSELFVIVGLYLVASFQKHKLYVHEQTFLQSSASMK